MDMNSETLYCKEGIDTNFTPEHEDFIALILTLKVLVTTIDALGHF